MGLAALGSGLASEGVLVGPSDFAGAASLGAVSDVVTVFAAVSVSAGVAAVFAAVSVSAGGSGCSESVLLLAGAALLILVPSGVVIVSNLFLRGAATVFAGVCWLR